MYLSHNVLWSLWLDQNDEYWQFNWKFCVCHFNTCISCKRQMQNLLSSQNLMFWALRTDVHLHFIWFLQIVHFYYTIPIHFLYTVTGHSYSSVSFPCCSLHYNWQKYKRNKNVKWMCTHKLSLWLAHLKWLL